MESISPIDLSIASNFFSRKECSDLFNLPNKEQRDYFFRLWVLKESFIKAEGKGLSIPLDSFSFELEGSSVNFLGDNSSNLDFSLRRVNVDKQSYQLGICAKKGRLPDKIIEMHGLI